jgi:DNA helicase HerA-like ATPase
MNNILVGVESLVKEVTLDGSMLNRHGLIAGATGTGKTVTLQVLAEQFSKLGISIFLTDIKGDLSGISKEGVLNDKISERLKSFPNFQYSPTSCAVNFIDLEGKRGHPLRVSISSFGPLLLSRLLELNDTQEGILNIAFKYADEEGLLLLDLKDLESLLSVMSEHSDEIKKTYGNITSSSIGAIQRRLLVLKSQGIEDFFGEPEFDVRDLLTKDFSGNGLINLLDATNLLEKPRLYGTVLLWLLSEVFETLEEVGDQQVPRLVLFFDEAHLLFDDLSKPIQDKLESVVRLVRSKGVGVFFVTQSPDDIPEKVLAQLGNRIQHALRAYTANDADKIKKIAKTFKITEGLDIAKELTSLSVGEALVSTLLRGGEPSNVFKVKVRPPFSQIGPISELEREELTSRSPYRSKYGTTIDRESAYEILKKRAEDKMKEKDNSSEKTTSNKSSRQGPFEAFFVSIARSVGSQIGKQILRGVLGTIEKK